MNTLPKIPEDLSFKDQPAKPFQKPLIYQVLQLD